MVSAVTLVLVSFVIATFAEPELDQPLLNEDDDQMNEEVMDVLLDERQTCPTATTCPATAAPCTVQNCSPNGRCCLDYANNRACCLPLGTGPVTPAAPSPSTSTVGLCNNNSKYGSTCRGTCTTSADCGWKSRCCRRTANATACCVYSGFFGI